MVTWDKVLNKLDHNTLTSGSFDQAIRDFVAAYSTHQDRFELVQQLLHPIKPDNLSVTEFYGRLLELNDAVSYLPGSDNPLTDEQIKNSFYHGMPFSWKTHFLDSGSCFSNMSMTELIRYFLNLERTALKRKQKMQDVRNPSFRRKSKKQRRH